MSWIDHRRGNLEIFLAGASAARSVAITDLQPLRGGAIQENWRLDLVIADGPSAGNLAVVLRADAPSTIAVSLTRAQEFAVLRAARAAGVMAPEPLWVCEDPSVLGRPFYVMRFLDGVALGPRVIRDLSLGGDREALVERLGRELARIHSIHPGRSDLDFLDMPEGPPALDAVHRYRRYLDKTGESRPALEWGLAWCERHAPPPPEQLVLVHQDVRTGNYLLDQEGLVAILDWEFCAWGDAMSDLGWFLADCWRFGEHGKEAGGIGSREAFYRGYQAESGAAIDSTAVAYWELMAHLRWAVIALLQGARHRSGEERSLELALTGRMVAGLELAVLQQTAPEAWSAST